MGRIKDLLNPANNDLTDYQRTESVALNGQTWDHIKAAIERATALIDQSTSSSRSFFFCFFEFQTTLLGRMHRFTIKFVDLAGSEKVSTEDPQISKYHMIFKYCDLHTHTYIYILLNVLRSYVKKNTNLVK